MREYNTGKIASVNGRYYAMDRDRRWERIAKAFNAMVFSDGEGGKYVDPVQGVKRFLQQGCDRRVHRSLLFAWTIAANP